MSDMGTKKGRADGGGRCTEGRETGRKALHVREEMEEGRKNRGKGKRRRSRREEGEEAINVLGHSQFQVGASTFHTLKESRVVLTYTVIEMH